jgi:glycosyltransferase involved in cell wall biosynthesis
MPSALPKRPPRLAIATLAGLDHFVPDLARALNEAGGIEASVFTLRSRETLPAMLAWADAPELDTIWFEFCWPPIPELLAGTDFGFRRVLMRLHRIEAYEADYAARMDWALVNDLIVVSADMARVVREVCPGIDRKTRLHVIHNGVDIARFPGSEGFDPFRLGWCGNFILRKNPTLALQILHLLHQHDRRYRLHIATPGGDRITSETFTYQARQLGINEAIIFDGRISAESMPAWHAANGVLLSTSLHESFGYAIAEAAASGCDIAVLDHPGAAEFWPPATRFVAVEDAARIIRQAAPNRWRAHIASRFSLTRQVNAVLKMLGGSATPASSTGLHATRAPA